MRRFGFSGRYTKVNRCLSEGRRRFHDRLAGIETGAECERLAPQLSALADGEATAADMTLLRPHLRTCLMCRARLRDYRAVPEKVAALAPPVAVAYSLLDSARHVLDAASGWLSERSAGLAARWHQAAELAAAHKVAAAAASTAVLAGGGAVTVATVEGDRSAAVRPAPGSSVAPSPAPSVDGSASTPASSGTATGGAAARSETAPAERNRAPTARQADEPSAPAQPGEFAPAPATAEPAAPEAKPPTRAASPGPEGGGEFAP